MAIRFNSGVTNEDAYYDGTAIKPINSALTFGGWFRRDADSAAIEYLATITANRASNSNRTAFYVDASDNLQFFVSSTSSAFSQAATVGSWFYLAYSCNSTSTYNKYIGTSTSLTASTALSSTSLAFEDIILGNAYNGLANCGRVSIAHFRVWQAQLSQAQLEAEMVATAPVVTSGLYAAYEFPNNETTWLDDSSGNTRTLTGTNIDFATNYVAGPLSGASAVIPKTAGLFGGPFKKLVF